MESKGIKKSKKGKFSFKRVALVFGILIAFFSLTFFVHVIVTNTGISISGPSQASRKSFEILSTPPETAVVGQNFLYYLRIGRYDSPTIKVVVEVKPEWLKWDSGKFKLEGTPDESYIGQNQIVLKVTDGTVTKEQVFSIDVEASEGEVEGIEVISSADAVQKEKLADEKCHYYYDQLGPLGVLEKYPECEGVFISNQEENEVLGAADVISDVISNVGDTNSFSQLSEASRVGQEFDILGIRIGSGAELGIVAGLTVVFVGIVVSVLWVVFTSVRLNVKGRKSSGFFIREKGRKSSKKSKKQQSFIEDDDRIVIWD